MNFTVLEMGEGPLVLCLHGFPDTAHSFRHQMPALSAAGLSLRRAVHARATRRPIAPRRPLRLGGVVGGRARFDNRARLQKTQFYSATIGAQSQPTVPRPPRRIASPSSSPRQSGTAPDFSRRWSTNYAQQRRSWTVFFFQTKMAEAAVSLNDFAFLEKLWTDWSPGWKWTDDDMKRSNKSFRAKRHARSGTRLLPRHARPRLSMPADLKMLAPAMNIPINVKAMDVPRPRRRMHRRRNPRRHGKNCSQRV